MADLAKLVVRMEAESSQLRKELEKTNKKMAQWEKKTKRSLSNIAKAFKSAFIVGAASVAGGSVFSLFGKVVSEADRTEQALRKFEAVLKSTGNASGFTAKQLDKFSRELARNTLASTEGVRKASGILLSFKAISGDTFRETLTLSQDLAAVMGGDISRSALQLAKALEDPITGLTRLRQSGVSFTESEQAFIKSLTKSGKLLEAQGKILEKVRSQVGGAGKAEASGTLVGALDSLGQAWDELLERIGQSGLAQNAIKFINGLTDRINTLRKLLTTDESTQFFNLADERKALQARLERANTGGLLGRLRTSSIKESIAEVEAEMRKLQDRNIARIKAEAEAAKGMQENRLQLVEDLAKAEDNVFKKLQEQKKSFAELVKDTRDAINFKPESELIKGTVLEAINAFGKAQTAESAGDTRGAFQNAEKAVGIIKSLTEGGKITDQFANSLLTQIEALGTTAADRMLDLKLDDKMLESEAERARKLIQANFSAQPFTAEIAWTNPNTPGNEPLAPGATVSGAPLILKFGEKEFQTTIPNEDADKLRSPLARAAMQTGGRC